MKINKLYGERVLIQPIEDDKTSEGGIILAGEPLDDVGYGTIVMLGEGCTSNLMLGMSVAYSSMMHPTKVRVDGVTFYLLHEGDVMFWAHVGAVNEL